MYVTCILALLATDTSVVFGPDPAGPATAAQKDHCFDSYHFEDETPGKVYVADVVATPDNQLLPSTRRKLAVPARAHRYATKTTTKVELGVDSDGKPKILSSTQSWPVPGWVRVTSVQRAPQLWPDDRVELLLDDAALAFQHSFPLRGLRLAYANLGASVYLEVDGHEVTAEDFSALPAQLPSGVQVRTYAATAPGTDDEFGLLIVTGEFTTVVVGGERVHVDDVCFQADGCDPLLPPPTVSFVSFLTAQWLEPDFWNTTMRQWPDIEFRRVVGYSARVIGGSQVRLERLSLPALELPAEPITLHARIQDENDAVLFDYQETTPPGPVSLYRMAAFPDAKSPVFFEPGKEYHVSVWHDSPDPISIAVLADTTGLWVEGMLRFEVRAFRAPDPTSARIYFLKGAPAVLPPVEMTFTCGN